jgi:hypothetical protein
MPTKVLWETELHEGRVFWGHLRVLKNGDALQFQARHRDQPQYRPLCTFSPLNDGLAFRMHGKHTERGHIANTDDASQPPAIVPDVAAPSRVRDDPSLRRGPLGED